MSERSSFVSDNLVYFGERKREVAEALVAHLGSIPCAIIKAGGALMVAGYARSSWGGGEWEDIIACGLFDEDVSLVVNCENGDMIRIHLKTGEFKTAQ